MLNVLVREIRRIVELYCSELTHQDAVLCALGRPGFALHPEAPCRAGAVTLKVYQAISGKPSTAAILGAAGVELQMEAAYIFDNVADQEISPSYGLSAAEELALGIAVMTCGTVAACEAVREMQKRSCGLQPLIQFHGNCINACAGQFLDARLGKRDLTTTDEALHMTSLKAGSAGRAAAEFGAGLATDDSQIIRLCGDFGSNTFIYAQLIDDLRDACPENVAQGDLARHKKTLPVAFFYESLLQSSPEGGNDRTSLRQGQAGPAIRRAFEDSRAEVFSAVVAEVLLNRAKANLAGLRSCVAGVEGLEEFLDSLVKNSAQLVGVSPVYSA